MKAQILFNSSSTESWKYTQYLHPYLEHFGVPYQTVDLAHGSITIDRRQTPLIIVSHPDIFTEIDESGIIREIEIAVRSGSGLVSFDPVFPKPDSMKFNDSRAGELTFTGKGHYITRSREPEEQLKLFGSMLLPRVQSEGEEILIRSRDNVLLSVLDSREGRVVRWTSMDWMHSSVLGPLGGLDGCLWRSIVWAAAKPFVMYCLPPIVTMRVDDVAGQGHLFNRPPLHWVETSIKYGFKPWLGLFIYNLRPQAIEELRIYISSHNVDAFPHAFGRPPRDKATSDFYYNSNSLPLRSKNYDEFVYFNHSGGKPWSDFEADSALKAVDEWYERYNPLPKSGYILPHYYQMSSNMLPYLKDEWGCDYIGLCIEPDILQLGGTPWLKSGPFRLYEQPGNAGPVVAKRGTRPVYYADFVDMTDRQFFNTITEIRDDAGYEWAPDNDVSASIGRGVRQIKRALDSLAHAVLFTHETDYIYLIEPDKWETELRRIRDSISDYDPILMSSDDAVKTLRSFKTCRIESYEVFSVSKVVEAIFTGKTDTLTSFAVFTEEGGEILSERFDVPVFSNKLSVKRTKK